MARGVTPLVPNANEITNRQIANTHEGQEVHRDKVEIAEQENMVRGAPSCDYKLQLQQMEAQSSNPDAEVSIETSYGPLQLCATFRRGKWIGHNLTQRLSDP